MLPVKQWPTEKVKYYFIDTGFHLAAKQSFSVMIFFQQQGNKAAQLGLQLTSDMQLYIAWRNNYVCVL